ncbi:MAG: sugar ABC transporter permease [Clostridia bacterium]|nr:sugar ABC transporter permease [Clostridia bacterium]
MTKRHMRWGWVFVSPYFIGAICFTLIPLLVSVFIAFTRYDLLNPPKWVGFQNFIRVLSDIQIFNAFRNVWIYAILLEGLQLPLACVLAVLLNQKIRGLSIFRVIYYIPGLTPTTAVALIWARLYNPNGGVFNRILGFIGLGPFMFTFSPNYFEVIVAIVIMTLWKGVGGATIYLIAGLQAINKDVIEAADIDGAGAWKKFTRITVPLLTPTIFFMLITGISGALQVFESFFVLAEDTGADVGVVNTKIYSYMWSGTSQAGLASALGWTSFVIVALVTWGQKKFEKKWVHYDE